jgi:hypothetical protein
MMFVSSGNTSMGFHGLLQGQGYFCKILGFHGGDYEE